VKPIILEGVLSISDQEGGYAEPSFSLDGLSVPGLLDLTFSDYRQERAEGITPPGRYRLTLEKIE
jgi:hypothetical protein